MKQRRSSAPRINAAPRFRVGGPGRGRVRPGPRRRPWIFGPSRIAPEPYVFTTPVEPDGAGAAAEPAGPLPDAPADASADGVPEPASGGDNPGGDGAPADQEDYDKRRPPKRNPSPRGVVGVTATLTWHDCLLTHYPIPPLANGAVVVPRDSGSVPHGSGVYIVCRGDIPIYVGETGSFRERWNARLLEAYQAGVIDTTLKERSVRVWFGVLDKPLTREERRTVEAAIIRLLIKGGVGGKLRQGRSFNEIRPGTLITLKNALPPRIIPVGVAQLQTPNQLVVPANSVFEAEFYELTPAS